MTREEAKELLIHILMTYDPKDQYGDYNDSEPYEQALTMAIEALLAEAEWIPCSEKLPDIGELVLITQNRGDGDKTVETAYLTSDGPNDLYWSIELFKSRETDEVLAWMPLPEPYRKESEVGE